MRAIVVVGVCLPVPGSPEIHNAPHCGFTSLTLASSKDRTGKVNPY
jgi:hypothetical protein